VRVSTHHHPAPLRNPSLKNQSHPHSTCLPRLRPPARSTRHSRQPRRKPRHKHSLSHRNHNSPSYPLTHLLEVFLLLARLPSLILSLAVAGPTTHSVPFMVLPPQSPLLSLVVQVLQSARPVFMTSTTLKASVPVARCPLPHPKVLRSIPRTSPLPV